MIRSPERTPASANWCCALCNDGIKSHYVRWYEMPCECSRGREWVNFITRAMRDYSTNEFRFGKYDRAKPHNLEKNFYTVLRDDPGYAKWCLAQQSRYPQMNVWRSYIHLRLRFSGYIEAEGLLSHMDGSWIAGSARDRGWDDPSDRNDGDPAIPTATVVRSNGTGH